MFGIYLRGPVEGTFKDISYARLMIKTKDPKDREATAAICSDLANINDHYGISCHD
jgi:hypothetical protein